jgi:hypothetical protein
LLNADAMASGADDLLHRSATSVRAKEQSRSAPAR